MGLDWNPLAQRQSAGHEAEFDRLYRVLVDLPEDVGWIEKKLRRWRGIDRDALDRRWREIQITPYETLQAPRVGADPAADVWAISHYSGLPEPKQSEGEFLRKMAGYYVLQLVPRCDGLPWYTNGPAGYVEPFSFRAQFLGDCQHIIGPATLERCYENAPAAGLASLGQTLKECAKSYSVSAGVAHVEEIDEPQFEFGTPESNVHILFSAARWCEYWSSRGHGLEAYF